MTEQMFDDPTKDVTVGDKQPTVLGPAFFKKMHTIQRQLKTGETVQFSEGKVKILGEAKSRSDRRRLESLRRSYEGPV